MRERENNMSENFFATPPTKDDVKYDPNIYDNKMYAYYKKGVKEPIEVASGTVIKQRYDVETHADFISNFKIFEGGKYYTVKEINGEEEIIVHKQLAPTMREETNASLSEYTGNYVETSSQKEYVEKIIQIREEEAKKLSEYIKELRRQNKDIRDKYNSLKFEYLKMKNQLEIEKFKNNFEKSKEEELRKEYEKEIKQQGLGDNTQLLMGLAEKAIPYLFEYFTKPKQAPAPQNQRPQNQTPNYDFMNNVNIKEGDDNAIHTTDTN